MTAASGPSAFHPETGMMPGYEGVAISPSDANNLAHAIRALYIGVAGNVKLVTSRGTTLEFIGLQAGSVLPMQAIKIFNTSTTATNLIGII
jgi:hypothetical protein